MPRAWRRQPAAHSPVPGSGSGNLVVGAHFAMMEGAACAYRLATAVAAGQVQRTEFATAFGTDLAVSRKRSAAGEDFVRQAGAWHLVSTHLHL